MARAAEAFVLLAALALLLVPLPESGAEGAHTVSFALPDGTVLSTQQVEDGAQVDLSLIPELDVPEGFAVFWGNVTMPIYEDTVFTATFVGRGEAHVVSYYDSLGGTCIHREVVMDGYPAGYSGIPSKSSDQQYDYVFEGWSADLSEVRSDMSVHAVFTPVPRSCEVRFFDYDRTLLHVKTVPYGGTLTDMPEEPSRSPTVGYVYEFVCWSITANGNSPARFTDITDTTFVFAFYAPVPREYTVTFRMDGSVISEALVKYNSSIGSAVAFDLFGGDGLAKMYRDPGMTKEAGPGTVVIGDTDIYVKKVPGLYDAERSADGSVIGNVVSVRHDASTAGAMKASGTTAVCDISQFGSGTVASIDGGSLRAVRDVLGGDAVLDIAVPRGTISMTADRLCGLAGDGDLTFSVTNGPSSIKITSALKRVNYYAFYSLVFKVDGRSVTDLGDHPATITIPVSLDEGLHGAAWNISSRGALTQMDAEYDGRAVRFSSPTVQFYAVGTDSEDAGKVKERVVVPYGEASVSGISEDGRSASLSSVSVDCLGGIFFVPSSHSSATIVGVSQGALNDVRNASSIVVPPTVKTFSWEGWSCAVADVYFLGDAPEFVGTVPSSVTVHRFSDAEGWGPDSVPMEMYLYEGAYKKDPFSFYFYVIGDEAVVHRYVTGVYVQIPKAVSAGGSEYAVAYIGDAAFMRGDMEGYGPRYTDYNLETVEIPSTVTDVMTRAFFGSTVKNLFGMDSVERIWDEAFRNCVSLSGPSFPDSLLFLGAGAFKGCSSKSFAKISLPDGTRSIGKGAFYGCTNLLGVKLGKSIPEIPADCFGYCTSLGSVTIPDTVREIGEGAFFNCRSITYVDLNNAETIGREAFGNSGATSLLECVVMGADLKQLGTGAFSNCTSVEEIEAYCPKPDSMDEAFQGVDLASVKYYVTSANQGSWNEDYSDVELLDEEIVVKKDHTMAYISVGLLVFFVIAGILSYKYRLKVGRWTLGRSSSPFGTIPTPPSPRL